MRLLLTIHNRLSLPARESQSFELRDTVHRSRSKRVRNDPWPDSQFRCGIGKSTSIDIWKPPLLSNEHQCDDASDTSVVVVMVQGLTDIWDCRQDFASYLYTTELWTWLLPFAEHGLGCQKLDNLVLYHFVTLAHETDKLDLPVTAIPQRKAKHVLYFPPHRAENHDSDARAPPGIEYEAETNHVSPAVIEPSQRLSWKIWRTRSGRNKSWRYSKYMKLSKSRKMTWQASISCPEAWRVHAIAIPNYLLARRGYQTRNPWYLVQRRRRKRHGGRTHAEDTGGEHDDNYLKLGDRQRDSCSQVISIHEDQASQRCNNLRPNAPRSTDINILEHECYIGAIIAPGYVLHSITTTENYARYHDASDLWSHNRYQLTALIFSGLAGNEKRYRIKLLKKLQKDRVSKNCSGETIDLVYIETVSQRGLVWVVHRLKDRDDEPHSIPTGHSLPGDQPHGAATKPAKQVVHDRFLRRGTREYQRAFPELPRTAPPSFGLCGSETQAQREAKERKQNTQRARRCAKRARKTAVRLAQVSGSVQ